MKRFLLFTGFYYYPCGGMDDFNSDYDTLESAIEGLASYLKTLSHPKQYWAHIYDTEARKEVFCSC